MDGYDQLGPEDQMVVQSLLDNGADLASPRSVWHYLYCPDEATATVAARRLSDLGWTTEHHFLDGQTTWSVVSQRSAYVLTPEALAADLAAFQALASDLGCEYDGWEASI